MANVSIANSDPRQVDKTTRVSIWVDGDEQLFVEDYSIDNDILNVGDPFQIRVPNIDGRLANRYRPGALCKIFMSNPDVNGGADVKVMTGRVVTLNYQSEAQGGSTIMIGGADLGWHLANTCAPIWVRLNGLKFSTLVSRIIDPTWGIAAVAFGNEFNRTLKRGRAGAEEAAQRKQRIEAATRQAEAEAAAGGATTLNLGSVGVQNRIAQLSNFGGYIPPLQIEPGQMVADLLVEFARRERWLMNVSADGVLQFFTANDGSDGKAQYSLRLYKSDSANRNRGNVKSARVARNIDGLYTRVICVGTAVMPPEFANPEDPNVGRFRGTYDEADVGPLAEPILPFRRFFSFADGDQYVRGMAKRRAKWRFDRGRFDAMQGEYVVAGHAQNGAFWTSDTVVDIDDEINGLKGKYYVSAVRFNRSRGEGTTTNVTVHELGYLGA